MRKFVVAFLLTFLCATCGAGVDVNKANVAELDGVKGIGPALSARILDERAKGPFKDWADLLLRVKGLGARSAAKLSAQGLTVNEAGYRTPQQTDPVVKK